MLAELSPSRRAAFFPIVELVLITGLIWMAIGLIDGHLAGEAVKLLGYEPHPLTKAGELTRDDTLISLVWGRRALLVLWVILAWRRCIRHLIYRQRSRMVLTDQRLITATGHLRSHIAQVPLATSWMRGRGTRSLRLCGGYSNAGRFATGSAREEIHKTFACRDWAVLGQQRGGD